MSKNVPYVFLNGVEKLESRPQPGRYFAAHGYPKAEPDDYREYLQQAFASKYQPVFADRQFKLKHILPKICELILDTDFGVYDISNPDKPNVFLELGIAIVSKQSNCCRKSKEFWARQLPGSLTLE